MKIVGLITEYNPFHNGHKYHIEEAKRITGADHVIVVMSGNYVQRGAPAIIDKYSRTKMALENGADLVLELPVYYATGSAEYFAYGSVALLDQLGVVDSLCFGSEIGDIQLLQEATDLLLRKKDSIEQQLLFYLKEGATYPLARAKAVEDIAAREGITKKEILIDILKEPNNILGIEYLKALHRLSSNIEPVTIKRKQAHYHEKQLLRPSTDTVTEDLTSTGTINSATAIRSSFTEDAFHEPFGLQQSLPQNVYSLLSKQFHKTFPITEEDFSEIIKYRLLLENEHTLTRYVDISKDIADRIYNQQDYYRSVNDLYQEIKTKNMTLTRISRGFTHLLLNLEQEILDCFVEHGPIFYGRVLGLKKEASHILRTIQKQDQIPLITKVSKAREQLDGLGMNMLQSDLFATHLYNQIVYEKYQTPIINEYKHGVVLN